MADVIEFFLKQANREDLADIGPPYLVNFSVERVHIEEARTRAAVVIGNIRRHSEFESDSHAAQYAIAVTGIRRSIAGGVSAMTLCGPN